MSTENIPLLFWCIQSQNIQEMPLCDTEVPPTTALWWDTTFPWALKCSLGSEQDSQSMEVSSVWVFMEMLFASGQAALRTAENKTNSGNNCTPGQESRWGALSGQAQTEIPKKGRNIQKKSVTQFRRSSRFWILALETQSEEQQGRMQSSSQGTCRGVTPRAGAAIPVLPCPALGRSQLSAPWRNAQALARAQVVLTKARFWFWSLVVPFTRDGLDDPCGTLPTQHVLWTPWE